jgi:GNAT superfamily N-acetyltransferase
MTITVRAAQPLDRVEILELYDQGDKLQQDAALIYRMGTREDFETHIDGGNVYVAVSDEPVGLLGMVNVVGNGPIQIIGQMIVREDFRGSGVGVALVEAAKVVAAERDAGAVVVIDRTPQRNSRLYREAGFKPIGEMMELRL